MSKALGGGATQIFVKPTTLEDGSAGVVLEAGGERHVEDPSTWGMVSHVLHEHSILSQKVDQLQGVVDKMEPRIVALEQYRDCRITAYQDSKKSRHDLWMYVVKLLIGAGVIGVVTFVLNAVWGAMKVSLAQ